MQKNANFLAKLAKIYVGCMCPKLQNSHFGESLPYTYLCCLGYALNQHNVFDGYIFPPQSCLPTNISYAGRGK